MEFQEMKVGRVFRLRFKWGEDFFTEVHNFARKQNIKHASLFVIGTVGNGRMVTGFLNLQKDQSYNRPIGEKREFFAFGTLAWPTEKPHAIRDDVKWEPQPYAHIHMALGPDVGEDQTEMLVGHLNKGLVGGVVDVYELL